MNNINLHIEKTEDLLNKYKNILNIELKNCENDLVSYEIRESLVKLERKENRFNKLKYNLLNKYNKKESESLKRIYKYLKRNLDVWH